MAFSYNFKHTADFDREDRELSQRSILMGVLLWVSWSLDNLFLAELVAISFIWGLISLIRVKSEPKKTYYEKR